MKQLSGIIALFIIALIPAVAQAHEGNSDYRSEIVSIKPERLGEGISVSVVNFDDHVRIENTSGKDILVLGYDDEPYARISADGKVEINLNSPSHYMNEDRFADVEIPDRADENAEPEWEQVGENGIFEWHDHRSHFMSKVTPPQVKDKSKRTKVFDYVIPIEVDGEPAKINGTLYWAGRDSSIPVIPFVILGLAVVAAIWFWIRRRRLESETDDQARDDGQPESKKEQEEAW